MRLAEARPVWIEYLAPRVAPRGNVRVRLPRPTSMARFASHGECASVLRRFCAVPLADRTGSEFLITKPSLRGLPKGKQIG
ncbi:hypothetical protein CTP10_R21390 [Cupriavidus sp. P-10]|uniref:hypothetical protein n=1 Tax=unclassified Cupriavidus TaxID=2640874 RepID=UPI0011C0CB91|nr:MULTISPECIES: hypothetical protein [unclassified Cupriavidus]BDB24775.1 hypothetical protein CTP10_R21390 [Cupriavidus sp. P-10]